MAAKGRMSVSIRLALVDKLRATVSKDQSPTARLFDSERASKATICDSALEIADWCLTGGFAEDMVDAYAPEFQRRLSEVDRSGFARGVHALARFLGASVEVDAERGLISITPPEALEEVGTGELDSRPTVEPKIPKFH